MFLFIAGTDIVFVTTNRAFKYNAVSHSQSSSRYTFAIIPQAQFQVQGSIDSGKNHLNFSGKLIMCGLIINY